MGASAMVTVKLPSQVVFETQISFQTTYETSTSTRNFTISATYDNDPIEAFLQIINHDGWFDNDHNALLFKFSSPFKQLNSIQMGIELFGDPAITDTFDLQWNQFKTKGLFRLSDIKDIHMALDYSDETCLTMFKFYNKYVGPHYDSQFTLILPSTYENPWRFELQTIFETDHFEVTYSFGAPTYDPTLSGNVVYKLENSQILFNITSEYDDEQSSLLISGNYDSSYWTQNLRYELILETSWRSIEYMIYFDQDSENYELKSNFKTDDNTGISFLIYGNYDNMFEMNSNFSSDLYTIDVSLGHKLMNNYIDQKIHTVFNSEFFLYELNLCWDEIYGIPMNATSSIDFSVLNNEFEFSLNHINENDIFTTIIKEDWNGQTLNTIHILKYHSPTDWNSTFVLNMPTLENGNINSELTMKEGYLGNILDFNFDSTWTEKFSLHIVNKANSTKREHDSLAMYGNNSILNSTLTYDTVFELNHVELSLDADFFGGHSVSFSWEHNFDHSQFIYNDFRFGNVFNYTFLHDLCYNSDFFGFRDFEDYTLRTKFDLFDSDYNFLAEIHVDEEYSADLELNLKEDLKLAINGSSFKGIDVKYNEYSAELAYSEGNTAIPNFNFILMENNNYLLKVFIEFQSLYPEFISSSKIFFKEEEANLDINFHRMEQSYLIMNGSVRLNSSIAIQPIPESISLKFFEFYFETNNDCRQSYCKSESLSSVQVNERKVITQVNGKLDYLKGMMLNSNSKLTFEYNVGFPEIYEIEDYILNATAGLTTEKSIFEVSFIEKFNTIDILNNYFSVLVDYKMQELQFFFNEYEFLATYAENDITMRCIQKLDNESNFIIFDGKITWKQGKIKNQYLVNFESGYTHLKKVSGSLSWQQRYGTAVDIKIRVNKDKFHANFRHTSLKNGYDGKITARLKNDFYERFDITLGLDSKYTDEEYITLLNVKKDNDNHWISGNLTVGYKDMSLSIQTAFEGFEYAEFVTNYERNELNNTYELNVKIEI
ncbi:unnamed protein product, partial [Meganyctiphanes norvegica]